ncbi:MAG: DUF2752 domain-containing protein [Leptospiraceae bacterium]|nr:DUF2752 domain-containing protein [Leptospiraceae bacterium]
MAVLNFINFDSHFYFPSLCLFKNFFDIPCFACGITRALSLFLKSQYIEAIKLNPLIILVVYYLIKYYIITLIKITTGIDMKFKMIDFYSNGKFNFPFIVIVIINWLYLIKNGT